MKLLTIISGSINDTYGGGQVYVVNLLKGFRDREFQTTVLSFVQRGGTVRTTEFEGHPLVELGRQAADWKESVERIIAQLHPDIIHAHGEKVLAMEIAAKHHIPCVVTAHHGGLICPAGALLNAKDKICTAKVMDENCLRCVTRGLPCSPFLFLMLRILPWQWRIRLSRYFEKRRRIFLLTPLLTATGIIRHKQATIAMLKETAAIVSPCERMKDSLAVNGITRNVMVIPHGIPHVTPHLLSLLDGKIKFLYVGRISYVKGIHVLLEALSKIDESRYELHIVGGSANGREQRYERSLRGKYAAIHAVWHGKVGHSDIPAFLSQCHVMVHPAICLEIFGLTIAEALAMGRPVLATRCGGAEMQIEDGHNGWLVPPNNAILLRKAIMRLLDSPKLIQECARNCHTADFQEHIARLMELYGHIAIQAKQQS